jgi:hypothetical protein
VTAVRGGDEWSALSGYQRERDHLAGPMMPAVAKLAGFGRDNASVGEAFKAMSSAMRMEWDHLAARNSMTLAAA